MDGWRRRRAGSHAVRVRLLGKLRRAMRFDWYRRKQAKNRSGSGRLDDSGGAVDLLDTRRSEERYPETRSALVRISRPPMS